MAEEGFPLPASSYPELTKIIKAYGHLTTAAELSEVSKLAAIHTTVVSANNAFLLAVNVIEGGKKKSITEKGRALAHSLEHEMPEDITTHWRDIVLANEFLRRLVAAVKIRNGMEPAVLHAHVAYSAGQPKRPSVMTGARTVVDILAAGGLLKEEDGKLVAVTGPVTPALKEMPSSSSSGMDAEELTELSPPPAEPETSGGRVAVTIQIQIQCTAGEIDGLGPKLKALLKELRGSNASTSIEAEEPL